MIRVKVQSAVVQDPFSLIAFEMIRNKVKKTNTLQWSSLSDSYQDHSPPPPPSNVCDSPPILSLTGETVIAECFSKTVSHTELTVMLGCIFEVADEIKEKPYWMLRRKPWPGSGCTEMWGFLRLCRNCTVRFCFFRTGAWGCLLAKCKRRRGKHLT